MFKRNTAVTGFVFGLVSSANGSNITTGTPVGYYILDGGAQTAIGDVSPVHEGNGLWSFDLTAGEMDGDIVGLTFTHGSAITAHFTIRTDTKIVSELNDAITAPTAVQNRQESDSNSTQLSAIVADTNELQVDNVPGLIAALNNLSAAQANAEADTALSDFFTTSAQLVDDIWDEVISKANHNVGQSSGKLLRQSGDLIQLDGSVSDASPTTTDFDTDLAQVDTYFTDAVMIFTNGAANAGIGKAVNSYVNASGHVTFVAAMAWPVTPVNGDDFVIVALHEHPIAEIQSGLATEAKQDILDTNVDSVLVDTADMQPRVAAIEVDTQNIQSRIPASLASGRMSSDTVALSGSTTAADNLEASALGVVPGLCEGTPTTTVIQTNLSEATDDHYIGRIVVFTSGDAAGEASDITDYTGATGTITITAITTAPSSGDSFVIV